MYEPYVLSLCKKKKCSPIIFILETALFSILKGLFNDLISEAGQKCMFTAVQHKSSRNSWPSIILPSSTSVHTLFQILHNKIQETYIDCLRSILFRDTRGLGINILRFKYTFIHISLSNQYLSNPFSMPGMEEYTSDQN